MADNKMADYTPQHFGESILRDYTVWTVYQPAVKLLTSGIDHIETLARVEHAGFGSIPIVNFLDLVDSADLSDAFDLHVIEMTIREQKRLRQQYELSDTPFSVNLNPRSLLKEGFTRHVIHLLQKQAVAGSIILEIPMGFVTHNPYQYQSIADDLTTAAISYAIDNFIPTDAGYKLIENTDPLRLKVMTRPSNSGNVSYVNYEKLCDFYSIHPELCALTVAKNVERAKCRDHLQDIGLHIQQGLFFKNSSSLDEILEWFARAEEVQLVADMLKAAMLGQTEFVAKADAPTGKWKLQRFAA